MRFLEDGEYRAEAHFIVHLHRRPIYYLTVIVAPTFLISALSILGIFSPNSNDGPRNEKVSVTRCYVQKRTKLSENAAKLSENAAKLSETKQQKTSLNLLVIRSPWDSVLCWQCPSSWTLCRRRCRRATRSLCSATTLSPPFCSVPLALVGV
jgi:hypothetical protein